MLIRILLVLIPLCAVAQNYPTQPVAKPAMVTRFAELGAEPLGGTPAQAAAYIRAEQEKWGGIIREAGIKLQ